MSSILNHYLLSNHCTITYLYTRHLTYCFTLCGVPHNHFVLLPSANIRQVKVFTVNLHIHAT